MTNQPALLPDDLISLPKLPAWVTSGRAETLDTVAFQSGAVLTVLDQLVRDPCQAVPLPLLGNGLALSAATATSKLEGRMARKADIRDAYHLTPPGEARGPDGDILAFWRDVARLRVGAPREIAQLIGPDFAGQVMGWLNAGAARARTHGPLAGCASVMQAVLQVDDRAERMACLLSDAVLARVLGWPMVLPMSAQYLTKSILRDLIAAQPGAELQVQTMLLTAIQDTVGRSHTLANQAAKLQAVAPKLRAKGSAAAVALFLSEDAVSPAVTLSPMIWGTTIAMTDRAARRFCDRLVELGVAVELTGRSTFRLYGIAP